MITWRRSERDSVECLTMKLRDYCSDRNPAAGCLPARDILSVQPFPAGGRLGANMGLPLPLLKARIGQVKERACSYVVRTVHWDDDSATFGQHGSAPNFQGDVLTLCTCKHQMRAT